MTTPSPKSIPQITLDELYDPTPSEHADWMCAAYGLTMEHVAAIDAELESRPGAGGRILATAVLLRHATCAPNWDWVCGQLGVIAAARRIEQRLMLLGLSWGEPYPKT